MEKKSKQKIIAFLLIVLAILFGGWLYIKNTNLVWYWGLGLVFGYVLQRSAFCLVASTRDFFVTGSTMQFRAVLVLIFLASIGFTIIKYRAAGNLDVVGLSTIGIPLMTGGLIFGIGMVLAGGCASGMIVRLAGGHSVQFITIISFVVGYFIASKQYTIIWAPTNQKPVVAFLPEVWGWTKGILVHILIIVLLYIGAIRWQSRRKGE